MRFRGARSGSSLVGYVNSGNRSKSCLIGAGTAKILREGAEGWRSLCRAALALSSGCDIIAVLGQQCASPSQKVRDALRRRNARLNLPFLTAQPPPHPVCTTFSRLSSDLRCSSFKSQVLYVQIYTWPYVVSRVIMNIVKPSSAVEPSQVGTLRFIKSITNLSQNTSNEKIKLEMELSDPKESRSCTSR